MSHLPAGSACQHGDPVCSGAIFQCVSLSLPAAQPANDQVLQQGEKNREEKMMD